MPGIVGTNLQDEEQAPWSRCLHHPKGCLRAAGWPAQTHVLAELRTEHSISPPKPPWEHQLWFLWTHPPIPEGLLQTGSSNRDDWGRHEASLFLFSFNLG